MTLSIKIGIDNLRLFELRGNKLISPCDNGKTKARAIYKVEDTSEKQVTFLQDAMFRIVGVNDWGSDKKEFVMEEIECW